MKKITMFIFGLSLVSYFFLAGSKAYAQQYWEVATSTATSTVYSYGEYPYSTGMATSSTSTTTGNQTEDNTTMTPVLSGSITPQKQLVLLQTELVVLFGKLVSQVASQSESVSDPSVIQSLNNLKLAWVSLAQNQISLIRLAFQI